MKIEKDQTFIYDKYVWSFYLLRAIVYSVLNCESLILHLLLFY
jgi:hypothetical protein